MKFRLRKPNSWLSNKNTINQIFVLTLVLSFALSCPLIANAATMSSPKKHKYILWHKQQSLPVAGKVVDSKGNPLPGVSVSEKGTANGIVTDVNGNFKLTVANQSSVLVFRFLGYISQEVVVGNQTSFSIVLADDVRSLNEVVVVGYGTQKKRDLTGAIASIGSKDTAVQPVPDAGQAIEGKAAGVQVITVRCTRGKSSHTDTRIGQYQR